MHSSEYCLSSDFYKLKGKLCFLYKTSKYYSGKRSSVPYSLLPQDILLYICLERETIPKKKVGKPYFLWYPLWNKALDAIHASVWNLVLIQFHVSPFLEIPESFKTPKEALLRTIPIWNIVSVFHTIWPFHRLPPETAILYHYLCTDTENIPLFHLL